MTQLLRPFSYGHGGLGVAAFALLFGWLLPRLPGFGRNSQALVPWLWGVVCLVMLAELAVTTLYLLSPAYLDHVEASVASSVHALIAGAPLYPPPDSYTFAGLLYGPLLAEINSLGYVLGNHPLSAKIIGWSAGWLAILILIWQGRRNGRDMTSLLALTYGLSFLLSFGSDVVVARTDPLLLLFAAISLTAALRLQGAAGIAVLGLLSGAALELKIHAPLYLLPSLFLWASRQSAERWRSHWLGWGVCFGISVGAAVVLPLVPQNVSASAYLRYLTAALHHGLTLDLFGRNCALVLGLWAPILLLSGGPSGLRRTKWQWRGFALALGFAESLVLVIASKPGAGVHHFLPFLPAHVFLFQESYAQSAVAGASGRAVLAAAASLFGMLIPTAQTFGHLLAFDLRLPEQTRQRDELIGYFSRFPGGMLGVGDDDSYELANFRPWVTERGVAQTDYGAFMDLQLSGTSDAALQSAFKRCAIPFVYVPKPGKPFTLSSYYNSRPLFSDELRQQFASHYVRLSSGAYFDVFGCTASGPHSQLSATEASHTRVVSVPESAKTTPVR